MITEKDLKQASVIMESWRFVDVTQATILVGGSRQPGATSAKLREGRDDVAALYNLLQKAVQELAYLRGQLEGITQR